MSTIRERVTLAIRRKGDTMKAVCLATDVKPQSLNKAMNTGSTTYPHWDNIAKYLDVPADWIRNGGPAPWEQNNRATENAVHYTTDDIENHPLVIELKTRFIAQCERHLDLVELCKEHNVPVSPRGIEETKAFLDMLYGNKTDNKQE